MKRKNKQSGRHVRPPIVKFGLLATILIFFFGMSVRAQTAGTNNCTTECHKRTIKKDILHGPAATDCTSCHESNGKEHPLEDVEGFTLFAEGAELC